MRMLKQSQLSFTTPLSPSKRLAELQNIDKVLDANPQIIQRLHADIVQGVDEC